MEPKDVPLTVEQLQAAMPKRQKHHITQSFVDELNLLVEDPDEREVFRNNLLGYTKVLEDPRSTIETYVQAVRYVSYKLLGYTNTEAWIRTFPERYQRLMDEGKNGNYIRSVVTNYNKGKMVQSIMEQTLVPTWVLNHDIYQQAVNTLAELMLTARSEKVRSDSASSLLTHLKPPEALKVDVGVTVKEDRSVQELRQATLELVKQQRLLIQAGVTDAREVAEGKLINGDFERIN